MTKNQVDTLPTSTSEYVNITHVINLLTSESVGYEYLENLAQEQMVSKNDYLTALYALAASKGYTLENKFFLNEYPVPKHQADI